jgi:hypothetical protein
MFAIRTALLAAALSAFVGGAALAQAAPPNPFDQPGTGAPNPFDQPAGTFSGSAGGFSQPAQQQQQQREPPCMKDFMPLREAVETRGKAVQAAAQRKATPQEACKLFNVLVAAQDKLRKFMEASGPGCGIPAQLTKAANDGYRQTDAIRVRVCQAAASHPAGPAGPNLSDALGTSRIADPATARTGSGGGTFDTLTGTPLGKR